MADPPLSVMGAFAEFECAVIRVCQRDEIAEAKQRGPCTARKPALLDIPSRQLRDRSDGDEPKSALAKEFGISRETIYSYIPTANAGRPRPACGVGQ
jgi:DNA invertase Pin-like site-specific DNA recombinase